MPTLEMLKKLLEEFHEKESLVREEIQLIYDEIAQLESKLETCKRRLSTIGGDHNKVLSMRQRYLENKFERVYSVPGNGQPAAPATKSTLGRRSTCAFWRKPSPRRPRRARPVR